MRRLLPMSLLASVALQTACAPDEATAPRPAPLEPVAQVEAQVSTSPSRIAFERCGPCVSILVMGADGSAPTLVTSGEAQEPAWSPDGTQIAFTNLNGVNFNGDIYVVAVDGSARTALTSNPSTDANPSWSPDGQRIAFWSRRDGNAEIYVMNADGSGQTRLTNDPAADTDPSWSPNGQRIAFVSDRDGNEEIYVMGADGSAPTRVTNHPDFDRDPSWSPDSRQIVFTSNRDGNAEIYVMGADGSAPTRLTNDPAVDNEPNWSPTGSIAFRSFRDGTGQIWVMNADGSAPTRLTNISVRPARSPSWWPWLDQTPPQLTLRDQSGEAQRWFGALIGYSVSATDDLDPAPEVVCTPPSPSIFPIGTTQVDCTATDNAGNSTNGSFLLTVRNQYQDLAIDVANIESIIASPENSGNENLTKSLAKLQDAREEFARTPTDRQIALDNLAGALTKLSAAFEAGEISRFGFSQTGRDFVRNARLTADQAIAEAKARGGDAEAIARAEEALANGDTQLPVVVFYEPAALQEAMRQYRKACNVATDA